MMYRYNDFVNEKLNIFGEMKNLFSKMLINIPDDIKKPIDDLLNRFNNSHKPDDFKKNLTTYLKIQSDSMKKSLNETKNTSDIIKTINYNLTSIYSALDAFTRNMKDDNYTFEKIFEESTNEKIKKLFVPDEKFFIKNVEIFSRDLTIDLGIPLGFDKKQISKEWEESKNQKSTSKPTNQTQQQPTQQPNTNQNVEQKTESKLYKYHQFILEQDEQKVDTTEQQQNKDKKDFEEKLVKLRTSVMKWFDTFLYKPLKEVVKKEPEQDLIKSLRTNINKMDITDNKESVSKMLNSITQIKDKNTLIELRDFLSSKGLNINKDIAPL